MMIPTEWIGWWRAFDPWFEEPGSSSAGIKKVKLSLTQTWVDLYIGQGDSDLFFRPR